MSAVRSLVEHFVAPADEAQARRRRAPAPAPAASVASAVPPAVGVLCAARHARSAGCAVALRLARRHRARAAVVALWTGEDGGLAAGAGAPPTREARRLARAIAGRDIAAHAAGRVVLAGLPAAQEEAAAAASRAFAVAASLPTVLVLAGPREEPLDALLPGRDLVLVAEDRDDALADLALAALVRRGIAARRCAVPAAPAAAVAARGAAVLPAARRGLDLALEGLG